MNHWDPSEVKNFWPFWEMVGMAVVRGRLRSESARVMKERAMMTRGVDGEDTEGQAREEGGRERRCRGSK